MTRYFNIQRFSTRDGDGIRSILFLKGCTLSCSWCQNPESMSNKSTLLFDQKLCLSGCQQCTQVCANITKKNHIVTVDRQAMKSSDIEPLRLICPTRALTVCGEEADEEELFNQLIKDKHFYDQSQGGVTFSGGEPLTQPEQVTNLARRLQEYGVSCAVESCLHVPWKYIEPVVPFIDTWLVDLKHTDETRFKAWTKGSLSLIKTNLTRLDTVAHRMIVRVPVVPGFNDTLPELQAIIDFTANLKHCQELHLLPYHTLGIGKYHLMGLDYQCSPKPLNKPELLKDAQQYAQQISNINVLIGG